MIQRNITQNLLAALADSPVVLLHGARQTGKSTLIQHLAAKDRPARYLTLDDASVLAAAGSDPAGFLASIEGPVALDEVQRAPGLFLAIKAEVDRRRQSGRFLLSGSANVLMLPKLSESLAGRMEILRLWPLSQGELSARREGFVDLLFGAGPGDFRRKSETKADLAERVVRGGYPEACRRADWERRRAWFNSYVMTTVQRDVRDLGHIEQLSAMPRLLALLAARVGSLLNQSELSRTLGLPLTTLARYLTLLETTFLVQFLPPWSSNLGKRLVKAPKVYLNDTGLACGLLAQSEADSLRQSPFLGPLVENFVVSELRKQITWSHVQPAAFHFRTQSGQEVDVVLESGCGDLVGVEIKASATVAAGDFRGLRTLADQVGSRLRRGVVLYAGRETVPFATNFHAVPIEALWET